MKSPVSHVTYKTTRLANGLRVAVAEMPHMTSVSIGIWTQVGGRYETEHLSGISHFLEHMVFKGTKRRSCEQLKQGIEGTGGMMNAFTAEEFTCYIAQVLPQHAARALDVVTDMLLHSTIAPVEVEKERQVIIEEIRMHRDQPGQHVHDVISELLWPRHPLGRGLAGTEASMARITRADIKKFLSKYYTPKNLLVSVAGNITLAQVIAVLSRRVRTRPGQAARSPQRARAHRSGPRARLRWESRTSEQAHACIAVPAVGRRHRDRLPINILHVLLGANMSSRLFREVREKRALAYDVSSYVKHFSDTGAFIASVGCEPKKLLQSVEVIIRELCRIKRPGGISKAEMKRAKDYYQGQFLLGLEDTMDHMLWMGESYLMEGKIHAIDRVIAAAQRCTATDVQRIARALFQPTRMHVAVVGPHDVAAKQSMQALIH